MEASLVPGRECGTCSACCVWLSIDDPELQKVQGRRCPNLATEGGCLIYPTRPATCRKFNCGWRHLKWVKVARPDQSDVLVGLHGEIARDGSKRMGIMVTLLNKAAYRAEGLAETVAAGIAAGVPVYLQIPGPPGYTYGKARINEALQDAVVLGDKAAIVQFLRWAWKKGGSGQRKRIVLGDHVADASSDSGTPTSL